MTTKPSIETQTQQLPLKGDVLFLNAHPDDEIMAHGQAITALAQHNPQRVYALTATAGESSTLGDQEAAQAGKRLEEAKEAYSALGVEEDKQFYLNLPDAKLHETANISKLADAIIRIVQQNGISTLVTPGPEGFDSHSDHIAVHVAAIIAATRLDRDSVTVWGLTVHEEGDFSLDVDEQRKKEIMLLHRSQHDKSTLDQAIDQEPAYQTLMKKESYQRRDIAQDYGQIKPISRHIP